MKLFFTTFKYSLLFIVLILFIFFGCEKSYEDKIVGTWKRMIVEKPGTSDIEIWAFSGNGKIYRSYNGTMIDTGSYSLNFKTLNTETFISIYGLRNSSSMTSDNGEYKIHDLDKSQLIMQRIKLPDGSSPYLWREFVKK